MGPSFNTFGKSLRTGRLGPGLYSPIMVSCYPKDHLSWLDKVTVSVTLNKHEATRQPLSQAIKPSRAGKEGGVFQLDSDPDIVPSTFNTVLLSSRIVDCVPSVSSAFLSCILDALG